MKTDLENLKQLIAEKDAQISALEDRVTSLENENINVKTELASIVDNVKNAVEISINKIVETVVTQLHTLTISKEENNEKRFDVLTEQVQYLVQIIKSLTVAEHMKQH